MLTFPKVSSFPPVIVPFVFTALCYMPASLFLILQFILPLTISRVLTTQPLEH